MSYDFGTVRVTQIRKMFDYAYDLGIEHEKLTSIRSCGSGKGV